MVTEQSGDGGSGIILLFLAIIIVFTGLSGYYALQTSNLLQSTQVFTNHALESHAEQSWNATRINSWLSSGKCAPQQYACPGTNKIIRWCVLPVPPGKEGKPPVAVGLVIGIVGDVEHIITGFASSVQNWSNQDKRCR